jgi:hypothetical protein
LRRNGQRAVLDETALVDKVGNVLARGAAVLLVALVNSGGPAFVAGEQVSMCYFVEVSAGPFEIDVAR